MPYFASKGYGVSDITDLSGRPLLKNVLEQGGGEFLLSDRVAQDFDFTIAQPLESGRMRNDRLDGATSSYIKARLGGGPDDELDHKIPLELGGSNAPSNLWIQPGIKSGASFSSDQLENQLNLDVVAGKISLLQAWRLIAEQKGFLLGEDSRIGTTFSISEAASQLYNIGVAASSGSLTGQLGKENSILVAQIKSDVEKLKRNPQDQRLEAGIFASHIQLVEERLNVTTNEATNVVVKDLATYAESKGIDPREVIAAKNLYIQKIINRAKTGTTVGGIHSETITKIATLLLGAAGGAAIIGTILLAIAVIATTWEAARALIAGEDFIATITGLRLNIIGKIGLYSLGGASGLVAGAFALNYNMHEAYDTGALSDSQAIQSMKDGLALDKQLSGFLPSTAKPPAPASSTGGGSTNAQVYTAVAAGGVLSQGLKFAPVASSIIEGITDLTTTAHNNLVSYLAALPGKIIYEVNIVPHVLNSDGIRQSGAVHKVVRSVSKKGITHYRTVVNKFAELSLYIHSDNNLRTKITTIVLGPTDSLKFNPTALELSNVAADLQKNVTTTIHPGTVEAAPVAAQMPAAIQVTPKTPGAASAPLPTTNAPAQAAQTLSGYYASLGKALPSVADRGAKYEALELGPAGTYVGTAEQNTRLLVALQSQGGGVPAPSTFLTSQPIAAPAPVIAPSSSRLIDTSRGIIFATPTGAGSADPNQLAGSSQLVYTDTYKPVANGQTTFIPPQSAIDAAKNAATLGGFFGDLGQNMPSIQYRGMLYRYFNLGGFSSYTGTSDQNNALLGALKGTL